MFYSENHNQATSYTTEQETLDKLYNKALITFENLGLRSNENLKTFNSIYDAADYETAAALGRIILNMNGEYGISLTQGRWNHIASHNDLQSLSVVMDGLIQEEALTDENFNAIFATPDTASDLSLFIRKRSR